MKTKGEAGGGGVKWSWKSHLDVIGNVIEEDIHPAGLGVRGEERPPDARIHGDEFLVLFPEIVLHQDLADGAQVEAAVVPLDKLDIVHLRNQLGCCRLAIEDEYEVGSCVQALFDEKRQILAGVLGLCVRIQHERPLARRRRRRRSLCCFFCCFCCFCCC